MRKIIMYSGIIIFLILSLLAIALASAESELLPSHKQKILKILNTIEKEKEEMARLRKKQADLEKGEDEDYNNLPLVRDLQREGKEIVASSVGKQLEKNIQEWNNSAQTKPMADFLNQEEEAALQQLMYISDELDEIYADELAKLSRLKHSSEEILVYNNEKLRNFKEKYGSDAIAEIREEFGARKKGKRKEGETLDATANYYNCLRACCIKMGGEWVTDAESQKLTDKISQAIEEANESLSGADQVRTDFMQGDDAPCFIRLPPMIKPYPDEKGCYFNKCSERNSKTFFLNEDCADTNACGERARKDYVEEQEIMIKKYRR